MLRCFVPSVALALACVAYAPEAQAEPIFFNIANCVSGDCGNFSLSGGGSVNAIVEVVNGNDLLITFANNLNDDAPGDRPIVTSLGFDYGSVLEGLTFDGFTVLAGTVYTPTFKVNTAIKSFYIDFGFLFSDSARSSEIAGRMDIGDVVQMLIGTTGAIDVSRFDLGVAKVGALGVDGRSGGAVLTGSPSLTATVPEPGSLVALMVGFGALGLRRRRAAGVHAA
jgi:hypothetical protein